MEGGNVITIIGDYFGPKGSDVVASVGGTDCANTVINLSSIFHRIRSDMMFKRIFTFVCSVLLCEC